jgi:hypothetical protein
MLSCASDPAQFSAQLVSWPVKFSKCVLSPIYPESVSQAGENTRKPEREAMGEIE